MEEKVLSIIIPIYNEKYTLPILLNSIDKVSLPDNIKKEIILVDDASSDGTYDFIKSLQNYIILRHEKNMGKGSAVISGMKKATGDFILIQDADLEYSPDDYINLLEPLLKMQADVVYGSRFLKKGTIIYISFLSLVSNKFLTWLSNIFTGMSLTDMETGYKVFRKEVIDKISLRLSSQRFGIEPEITSLIKRESVIEVPISFNGRSVREGKKIRWYDGIMAIWFIFYFNVMS